MSYVRKTPRKSGDRSLITLASVRHGGRIVGFFISVTEPQFVG